MNDQFANLLHDLHLTRIGGERAKTEMMALIEQVKSMSAYMQAYKAAEEYAGEAREITQEIEALCLPQFEADGNKHPHNAITIKEFDVVSIPVTASAREWCFTNLRPALKLDVKIFEKFVLSGNVPAELASVTKEPRVQIAQDLTKYLDF